MAISIQGAHALDGLFFVMKDDEGAQQVFLRLWSGSVPERFTWMTSNMAMEEWLTLDQEQCIRMDETVQGPVQDALISFESKECKPVNEELLNALKKLFV